VWQNCLTPTWALRVIKPLKWPDLPSTFVNSMMTLKDDRLELRIKGAHQLLHLY